MFYVYLWKTRLGRVVYVGKGSGNRAYRSRNGLKASNHVVVIVNRGLAHRAALSLERQLQNEYGVGVDDPSRDDWRREPDPRAARDWHDDAFDEDEISSTDDADLCQF